MKIMFTAVRQQGENTNVYIHYFTTYIIHHHSSSILSLNFLMFLFRRLILPCSFCLIITVHYIITLENEKEIDHTRERNDSSPRTQYK